MNTYGNNDVIKSLCSQLSENSHIEPSLYEKFHVKRGLRRSDGTGVMAGITNICNVHGYIVNEGEKEPIEGKLVYRGYNINDIVSNIEKEDRFGFEETAYLLLVGKLPTKAELDRFTEYLSSIREIPENFAVDMIMHPIRPEESTAQTILSLLRTDRQYTKEEAQLLDILLMLHAEHGGGNNSTFTCRVLTSSGTDAYAAYAGAISSLKGSRHGGANMKVMHMLEDFKENVKNWEDEGQVADHLRKVINKEANDHSGLVYGMGHAVYTLSDPREKILKRKAMELAKGKDIEAEFRLLDKIETLTPEIFKQEKGSSKVMCANVDMYSGLVYKMLGIPSDLYTPLFAIARMAGWSAHRMEEMLTCGRIIRPAYKAIAKPNEYVPIDKR